MADPQRQCDEATGAGADNGPDLPAADEPFALEHYYHRWPLAVEKVELWNGQALFSGAFDDRDLDTARRCFPGRQVWLTEDGALVVGAGPGTTAVARDTLA